MEKYNAMLIRITNNKKEAVQLMYTCTHRRSKSSNAHIFKNSN